MSLTPLILEGFEAVSGNNTSMVNLGSNGVSTNYGRFGGTGLWTFGNSTGVISLPAATSVAGFGYGFASQSGGAFVITILYDSAGNQQGAIQWNANGSLSVLRFNGVVLGTSAAGLLPYQVYAHLEFQCAIDPTVGTWDVWVNGACVLSLSGLNTRGSSVVGSGASLFVLASGNCYLDDVVVYDAANRTGTSGSGTPSASTFEHYGDKRVQTLFPSGAGTGDVGSWTQVGGTAGQPFTAVKDTAADTTSYVADATPGDTISFALTDLASGTTGIAAVAPTVVWEKDDAAARSCTAGVRNSSTNAFGATRSAPSTYARTQDIRSVDATGAALTTTNVNAMELLFKVVS